ncbi:MAG: PilW family protein [Proteobacteria bacterium]|nr:PilW family protein [Pseudomonadota bacterium]
MKQQRGFTLVELMLSLALTSLVTIILFTVFRAQQRGQQAQTEVSQMQQTIRAAMEVLTRDLHNLGVDSTDSGLYGFSVTTPPTATQLFFTADLNEDAGAPATADPDGPLGIGRNETFSYSLFDCDNAIDFNGDGAFTTDNDCLNRRAVGGARIADNVEGLEFRYLLTNGLPPALLPTTAADFAQIAFVEVSLLVRANRPDPDFTNTARYTAASGTDFDLNGSVAGNGNPANDHFRRRLHISRVRLRNQ